MNTKLIDVQIINSVNKNPELFPDRLQEMVNSIHDAILSSIDAQLDDYEIAFVLFNEAYRKIIKQIPVNMRKDFDIFYKAWDDACRTYDEIAEVLKPVVEGDWINEYYNNIKEVDAKTIESDWEIIYKKALEKIKHRFGNKIAETIKDNISSIITKIGSGYEKLDMDYMNNIDIDLEEIIGDAVGEQMSTLVGDYNNMDIKFKLLKELVV